MARFVWSLVMGVLLVAAPVFGSAPPGHGIEGADAAVETDDPIRGIKLGDFTMRDYSPVEGTKLRIHFTLYAGVKREHATEFDRLLQESEARVRDQILTAVRLVPPSAYEEPDLKTFLRRILLRLRRAMPELQIDELYLTDFNFLSK